MCKRILTNSFISVLDSSFLYIRENNIRRYGARFDKYDKTLYAVIIPDDALFEGL